MFRVKQRTAPPRPASLGGYHALLTHPEYAHLFSVERIPDADDEWRPYYAATVGHGPTLSVIFGTQRMRNIMRLKSKIAVDGTFRCVPRADAEEDPSRQLLCIHIMHMDKVII